MESGLSRGKTSRTVLFLALTAIVLSACVRVGPVAAGRSLGHSHGPPPQQRALVGADGRWFVDTDGRVVGMRGVNFVQKFPPVTPASVGFDDDDAAFLATEGYNVVRLGVVFGAVMPAPGQIDQAYVDGIAQTTRTLARHGLYVLLDFHQDGYGPAVHGNGFPEWATLTDGLPNPNVDFPLYYLLNPALQRAFDNFWLNKPGPDGIPLQQHYGEAVRAVAASVAYEPHVLGYDLMNEPWPGTDWTSCADGCPALEQARLVPFARRMTAAIRAVDHVHMIFSEPFVLFNFGHTDTVVPPTDTPGAALSFHVYANTPADEPAVVLRALKAAFTRNVPLLATEFGATRDPATIERISSTIEWGMVPWIFWSYDENIVADMTKPPVGDNVHSDSAGALARPYAAATNGTPTSWHYDATSGTVDFSYSTLRPDGSRARWFDPTVVEVPLRAFPNGYRVRVRGAFVVSAPNAPTVRLWNGFGARTVSVHIERR